MFRFLVTESASGAIFVHNHPSGDPTPSAEDLAFTRRVAEAGDITIWADLPTNALIITAPPKVMRSMMQVVLPVPAAASTMKFFVKSSRIRRRVR